MIIIDNDYMINERACDVRSILKVKNNASNIAEIFLKQLSYRVYDFVITNSVNFMKRSEVDIYLEQNEEWQEDFKRALGEQALYVLSNGDLAQMLPDGQFDYVQWQKMRMSPATIDILKNLGFLRRTMSDQDLNYNRDYIELFDPTRNW